MNHPEWIYWALVACLALPSSAFSRVAMVVVFVRMICQIAYGLGIQGPETLMVIYGFAFLVSLRVADKFASFISAAIFLPLAVTAIYEISGGLSPVESWWAIYWLAIVQTLALPFGVEWMPIWRCVRELRAPQVLPRYPRRMIHA